ncbi:MAG: DUF2318 domain-containing protein [Clostridia bacterium]|nr:DUF2318 domain-containing protein [Clostridia bacterium]MBR2287305.1 DUF2318 domain-containing protein [Clostridia bacterium]
MKRNIALALLLLLSLAVLAGCSATSESNTTSKAPAEDTLTIDAQTLTEVPSFVDWTQDGTVMQLLAMKDAEGQVKVAFNTCQNCNGSPYAWFENVNDTIMQCQNCGLTFPVSTIGTARAAGCNPIPVTDFTVSGDTVTVSSQALKNATSLFTNWKKVQ